LNSAFDKCNATLERAHLFTCGRHRAATEGDTGSHAGRIDDPSIAQTHLHHGDAALRDCLSEVITELQLLVSGHQANCPSFVALGHAPGKTLQLAEGSL
jgi:hypothetical protein